MNKALLFVWVASMGFLAIGLLSKFALHWSAHRKIRQTFKETGATVTRIRHFNGFLDLGSISKAATSAGYVASVVTHDGRESDIFCLVRYLPLLGFARSVEIWPKESGHA